MKVKRVKFSGEKAKWRGIIGGRATGSSGGELAVITRGNEEAAGGVFSVKRIEFERNQGCVKWNDTEWS